jgi:hypothetical protein
MKTLDVIFDANLDLPNLRARVAALQSREGLFVRVRATRFSPDVGVPLPVAVLYGDATPNARIREFGVEAVSVLVEELSAVR